MEAGLARLVGLGRGATQLESYVNAIVATERRPRAQLLSLRLLSFIASTVFTHCFHYRYQQHVSFHAGEPICTALVTGLLELRGFLDIEFIYSSFILVRSATP